MLIDSNIIIYAAKPEHQELRRFIAKHASGNHPHRGPFAEALVDGLKAAAAETRRLHGTAVDCSRAARRPASPGSPARPQ